jgi:hypothetical protein
MNERITQLAEQARIYALTLENRVDNYVDVFEQKFAELLVKECANAIINDTANYPGEGMMAYYQGVQDAVKIIQKNFGVKEC